MSELDLPPLAHSYWVKPGRLLAGEYPGSRSRADTLHRLKCLLDSGVSYFLDLTEPGELAPYDGLLGVSTPGGREIIYERKPIRDHAVPTVTQMHEIQDYLAAALADEHCVYVHCRAGIGRTGTVIACHLMQDGLNAQAALEYLQSLWIENELSEDWPQTPETDEQMQYVREWRPKPLRTPTSPSPAVRAPVVRPTAEPARREPPHEVFAKKPAPPVIAKQSGAVPDIRARYLGVLVGLAVGDALGTTVQNKKPGSFEPVETLSGGGAFDLPPGAWTDDTAMTLCLAESLLAAHGSDARDQVTRYARWQREGYLSSTGKAIGITSAVARAVATAQWSGKPYAGSHDPKRLNAEALPRMAAVSLYYAANPVHALEQAADTARITHQSPGVLEGCRYMVCLLLSALEGVHKDELAAAAWKLHAQTSSHTPSPPLAAIAAGSFRDKMPPQIVGGGTVYRALEAALWALYRGEDFHTGAVLAVNLGLDADVTGALYGQLAGACYGIDAIPSAWIQVLAKRALIEDIALRLYAAHR